MADPVCRRSVLRAAVGADDCHPFAAGSAHGPPRAPLQKPLLPRRKPQHPARRQRLECFAHRGACASWPDIPSALTVQAIAMERTTWSRTWYVPATACRRRHENNIVETTDVATRPEFASRRTTKTIEGRSQSGWSWKTFRWPTQTLRAIERLPASGRPTPAMTACSRSQPGRRSSSCAAESLREIASSAWSPRSKTPPTSPPSA